MKRFLLLITLSLCFSLMGCMQNKSGLVDSRKDTVSSQEETNISQQLHLIVDQVILWKAEDETEWWGYAVTDIDKNGRLEMIASQCQGSGHFTSTQIWEVNESRDTLSLCQPDERCGPVMMPQTVLSDGLQSIPVYYDSKEDRHYYILEDVVNDGARGYYVSIRAISLQDGTVTGRFLAFKDTAYSDMGENATFVDADGNSISESEYESMADRNFTELEKSKADMQWIENAHMGDINEYERYAMIETSYDAFIIK